MIDTKKVQRRDVTFTAIDDALADAQRLADAARAGTLTQLGNWSLGQALGHLATWINFAYDGAPIKAPWLIRMVMPLMKKKMLHGRMPVGVRIPKVENGTLGIEPLSLEEGLARFTAAVQKLKTTAPTAATPSSASSRMASGCCCTPVMRNCI